MIDLQLLAVAFGAILLIVAAVSCFLIYGNREKTFEDVLAEKKGLNILLKTGDGGSSLKKASKEHRKKKVAGHSVPVATTKANVYDVPSESVAEVNGINKTPHSNITQLKREIELSHDDHISKKEKSAKSLHNDESEIIQIKVKEQEAVKPAEKIDEDADIQTTIKVDQQAVTSETTKTAPKKPKKPKIHNAEVQEIRLQQQNVPVVEALLVQHDSPDSDFNPAVAFRLRREIQEKDTLIEQLNEKQSAATKAVKELKQCLFAEQQKQAQTERSINEQMNAVRVENQALNQKVREFQSQLTAKIQAYRQVESQLMQCRVDQGHAVQAQQLREDNSRLKERLGSIEQEMLARNNEVQLLKQELMSHDSKLQRSEQQRQELEQMRALQETTVTQQLLESQNQLVRKDQECSQMTEEMKTLRNEISLMEQDHRLLRQQLGEKEAHMQTLAYQSSIEMDSFKEVERSRNQLQELLKAKEIEISHQRQLNEDMITSNTSKEVEMAKICEARDKEINELYKELQAIKETLSSTNSLETTSKQTELNNIMEEKKVLDFELNRSKEQLAMVSKELHDKSTTCHNLTEELKHLKAERLADKEQQNGISMIEVEKLRQHNEHLELSLSQQRETIKQLEHEIKAISISSLTDKAAESIPGIIVDPEVLKVNERSLTHMNKQVINKELEISQLKEQIASLNDKNMMLREEKYKAIEAVQASEKSVQDLIGKVETKCRSEHEALKVETRDVLCRLLPEGNQSIKSSQDFKKFLADYASTVQKVLSAEKIQHKPITNIDSKIAPSKHEGSYKAALTETERQLADLETKAIRFEEMFASETSNVQKQMKKLQHETSVCLGKQLESSTEVHSQLQAFKTSLEQAQQEKLALLKQLTERNNLLEREKQQMRELDVQVVQLKGMLKTGEDALRQEQQQASGLRDRLHSLQQNGDAHSIYDKTEELQQKLQQREQQLEREMIINKQLNNKLASLGVAATSF